MIQNLDNPVETLMSYSHSNRQLWTRTTAWEEAKQMLLLEKYTLEFNIC